MNVVWLLLTKEFMNGANRSANPLDTSLLKLSLGVRVTRSSGFEKFG
jgi:hypothetical protein